jgi:hypothetical protein
MSIPAPRWSGTSRCSATPCVALAASRRAADRLCGEGQFQRRVLKVLGELGAGADTVSEGEVRRALAAGVPPERIVFSGVGKTDREIAFALNTGVAEINVESEPELILIAAGRRAKAGRPGQGRLPGQSGRRGRRPRQDRHRQVRQQVRRVVRRGRAPLRQRQQQRQSRARRRRLPHRQPDHRPGPHARRLPQDARPGRAAARRRPVGRAPRPRRRPGRALFQPPRPRPRRPSSRHGRRGPRACPSSWPSSPAG